MRPLAVSNAALDQSIVAKYGAGTSLPLFCLLSDVRRYT